MWREIGRHLPTALSSTRWLIGDGQSIDVTSEPWVDTLPLRSWPTMVDVEAVEGLRVSDLLAGGGAEWDDARLRQLFGVHLAARIRSLPLPGCGGRDVRVWGTSSQARVRLGDLSRVLQSEQERGSDCTWIWRHGLHPRLALFLWKVFWDRLSTRAALSRRGWGIPAECGTCGAVESADHVLFQCIWARLTWQWAGIPQEARSDRPQFLHMIRQGLPSSWTCQEAIRATCTAYQIWLARNARTLGERGVSPRFAAELARVQASEFVPTTSSDRPLIARDTWGPPSASAAHQMVFFTWEPPPLSFLKVNFDGSVLDSGMRGGAGFIIRGPHSRVVAAGGCQLFDTSVPEAELRAAWAGVRHARMILRARSIILEGDSTTVIGWIRRGSTGDGTDHPLIRDIGSMMRDVRAFQAQHVFREANGAADWVAAHAAHHSGYTLWSGEEELPHALRELLYFDFLGSFSRILMLLALSYKVDSS
ncbi:uncharacterized protein LOC120112809 [Phoenix dactylifera]|uniref:Uncharacterized protein LOC120112809 n=1 Tax=Phoenix dactylifera TaxID=42345 RepID=A0A8B9AYW9_PHODC|nr:uncharacterized protein LOC120112809 [Phoenix dactylifera]